MDDLFALSGGAAARKWQKRHAALKAKEPLRRKRRAEREAVERRREARIRRRKLRAKIEAGERRAFLRRRKAEGYRKPTLPYKDLVGKKFGLLLVIRPGGHNPSGSKRWWVKCNCGSPMKEVPGTNLQQGLLRSCGFYCPGHKSPQWHKPEVERRKRAAEKARRLLASIPLSYALLLLARTKPKGTIEAKLLRRVRKSLVRNEIELGLVRSVDGKRPIYPSSIKEALRLKASKSKR